MVIAPQDGEEEEVTVEVEALGGVEGLEAVGLVEIAWARLVLA